LFEKWQYGQRRGIFPPDEVNLTQGYWMYFKENPQSMVETCPLIGHVDIFQTGPGYQNKLNRFIVLMRRFLVVNKGTKRILCKYRFL